MREQRTAVNIIGAGLAGLSAAMTCARQGVRARLISLQPSERAQSNLAEGGINAALDVMGEQDAPSYHYEDTMKGGCCMADPNMVRNLTQAAPGLVRELDALGVPFHREDGHIAQRNFGGQKKKRTAYAKSSTGKVLMTALTDEVRKYEVQGLVERYPHHRFECLLTDGDRAAGAQVFDRFRKERIALDGAVIMACGGTCSTIRRLSPLPGSVFWSRRPPGERAEGSSMLEMTKTAAISWRRSTGSVET